MSGSGSSGKSSVKISEGACSELYKASIECASANPRDKSVCQQHFDRYKACKGKAVRAEECPPSLVPVWGARGADAPLAAAAARAQYEDARKARIAARAS